MTSVRYIGIEIPHVVIMNSKTLQKLTVCLLELLPEGSKIVGDTEDWAKSVRMLIVHNEKFDPVPNSGRMPRKELTIKEDGQFELKDI